MSESWFYISFARPGEFAGAMVVAGTSPLAAVEKAIKLGRPKDAEAMAIDLPDAQLPSESYRNRLLTKDDIKLIWGGGATLKEAEDSGLYDMDSLKKSATFVCADCIAGKCQEHRPELPLKQKRRIE